jgi:sugar diacid utilization regulator
MNSFGMNDSASDDVMVNQLFYALIQDKGMQTIINIGYQMIVLPIYLVDSSFKLIALSQAAITDDPLFKELMDQEYFSYNSVMMFQSLKSIEKVNTTRKTVIMERFREYPPVAITGVFINRVLAANLVAVGEDRPFTQKEMDGLSLLKDIIATELQKNRQVRSHKGYMYETFINDIIDGRITKSDVIEERAKYLNLNLKEDLFLISIFAKNDDSPNSPIYYLSDLFERAVSGSRSVICNGQIVLLTSVDRNHSIQEQDLENLIRLLRDNGLYAGVSNSFKSLSELHWQYIIANKAVELGLHMNDNKVLFKYDDYTMYHIGDICSMNHELKTFCHPAVLALDEYDRQNGTQYLQSLYYYLTNKKQLHTSNALHIHRNTLNYRMEKIARMVDIDLNNSETFIHLCLSFKFIELLNGKRF